MTILADTVDIVIGVDPHKHTHTAAVIAADTARHHGSITAQVDPGGFAELLGFARQHDGTHCWVIEGCGSWGRGLATWLQANGEDVREIDSPSRPARRMGKKTDDLDALRVAREALSRDDLATPRDTGDRDALAALLVARRSAVEMTGDTERQLVSLAAICPEVLAVKLRGKTTAQIVEVCCRWRPTGDQAILGVAEAMRALARRICTLRVEAEAHQNGSTISSAAGGPISSSSSASDQSSRLRHSSSGHTPDGFTARARSPCSPASLRFPPHRA